MRQHGPAGDKDPLNIDPQHRLKRVERHFQHWPGPGDTGVVDKEVDLTEAGEDGVDRALDASGEVTSATTARPPVSAATARAAASSRSSMATAIPSPASRRAISRPIPPPPPVISPTRPFIAYITASGSRWEPAGSERERQLKWAMLRKSTFGQPGPQSGPRSRFGIALSQDRRGERSQARAIVDHNRDLGPLLANCREPAGGASSWLGCVFQQMDKQHGQPGSDFAAVAAGHAFEFLGDVFEVEAFDLAAPCPPHLVLEPGDEVVFIVRRISRPGHCHSLILGTPIFRTESQRVDFPLLPHPAQRVTAERP